MHLSFALLITVPLSVLAGPTREVARAVNKKPQWANSWNGRCTSTRSATKTITSTRRTTKCPGPTTTTIVVVQTIEKTVTLPQVTNIFSTTSTFFETNTITQSATATETVSETITNTIPPPTSSIPAPAGYTPIRSVYPNASSAPPKRELEVRGKAQPVCVKPSDMKCKTTIYTTVTKRTSTRYVTSTATARRATVTKKSTSTLTTTVSVLPTPASQTATFSTTSTLAATITNTQTATVTATTTTAVVTGPTPTTYAACAPDNILDQHNGLYIDLLVFGPPGGSVFLGSTASAYDCCVACLNTANCAGAGYLGGTCIGLTPDVSCDGSTASGQFGGSSSSDAGWRVSNSGCGQWSFTSG